MNLIEQNINKISSLCESHKVKYLYAFGSVLTNKFSEKSDIDLIVDFDNVELLKYADNYFDFKFSLEDILNRPIDLLEEKAIKKAHTREVYEKRAISNIEKYGNSCPANNTEIQKTIKENIKSDDKNTTN